MLVRLVVVGGVGGVGAEGGLGVGVGKRNEDSIYMVWNGCDGQEGSASDASHVKCDDDMTYDCYDGMSM